MSWLSSLLAAVLCAIAGAFGAFFMAGMAVDWLRIPAREGEAGYFVVFMGLFGIAAGALIGLVVTRFAGGPGLAGFGKGLGVALIVLFAAIGVAGGMAKLSSDPWPTVGGRDVQVEFELRGYEGLAIDLQAPAASSSPYDGPVAVWLGSYTSGLRYGIMRFTEARMESGRWIIPGSMGLFTSLRDLYFGMRAENGRTVFAFFESPRPLKPDPQWSDWLAARPDPEAPAESGPNGYAIRYRFTLAPEETP
jgi:hypothetical protein